MYMCTNVKYQSVGYIYIYNIQHILGIYQSVPYKFSLSKQQAETQSSLGLPSSIPIR